MADSGGEEGARDPASSAGAAATGSEAAPESKSNSKSLAKPGSEAGARAEPERERDGRRAGRHEDRPQQDGDNYDVQFHATNSRVYFGSGPDEQPKNPPSGDLSHEQVAADLAKYIKRGIDSDLNAHLARARCLVLVGRNGSGRRTAAIHALAKLTGYDKLTQLELVDPFSADELPLAPGRGYIIDSTSTAQPARLLRGPALLRVRNRLEADDALLIVIGSDAADWSAMEQDDVFRWTAPSLEEVLSTFDLNPPLQVDRAEIAAALGAEPKMQEIWDLLHRLEQANRDGVAHADVLAGLPEAAREGAQTWFAEGRDIESWALMATLVFFAGTPRNAFVSAYEHLVTLLNEEFKTRSGAGANDDVVLKIRSFIDQLEDCRAHITPQRHSDDGMSIEIPVIDFSPSSISQVYLEEFWRAVPARLSMVVTAWLADLWVQEDDELDAALGHRSARLAAIDARSSRELVNSWASTPHPRPNHLAAATVDHLAQREETVGQANDIVEGWRNRSDIGYRYSELYVFSGRMGLNRLRRSVAVFHRQSKKRPAWALEAWEHLSRLAAEERETALVLVSTVARLKDFDPNHLDVRNTGFLMVGRWFADDRSEPPVALRLAVDDEVRDRLVDLVTMIMGTTYSFDQWLLYIAPWADSADVGATKVTVRLIYLLFKRLPKTRAGKTVDWLESRLEFAATRPDGPTRLAVERCLRAARAALETRPQLIQKGQLK